MLGFAAWNVLAVVTSNGLLQLTMISAQVTSSAHNAGVYAAALTLATPASMLGQALGQVLVPAFAHRTDGGSLRSRGALLLVVGFAAASAVVFGLVALLAGWFLPIVYPTEGAAAVADLRYLMVAVWVFTVGLVPAALLLAAGRSRQVALASVAGFVVGVGLMAVLGPVAGVAGGTTEFLVGSAVNLVAVVGLGVRRAGAAPRTALGIYLGLRRFMQADERDAATSGSRLLFDKLVLAQYPHSQRPESDVPLYPRRILDLSLRSTIFRLTEAR